MSRSAQVLGLVAAAWLGWLSVPVEAPALAFEPLGAGEVVPAGFVPVHRVLSDRAAALGPALIHSSAQAIAEEAGRVGFDPLLVVALIDVESDFQYGAVSQRGARGLMQIRPATLEYLGERFGVADVKARLAEDPTLEIRLGVRYLHVLRQRFGNLDDALLAYNLGPAKLRRVRREHGLAQYQDYLRAVKRDYAQLQREIGVGGDWTLAARPPP